MCRWRIRVLALAHIVAVCAAHAVAAQSRDSDQLTAHGAISYVFYCAACHGGNGGGDALHHVPPLAGRAAAALVRQITALKDAAGPGGSGGNHARSLAALNAAQIEGIADYLASLVPPPSAAH
jgi:cytochrome c553